MNLTISFRQLDHTEAIEAKIREKAEKLLKHLSPDAEIQWTCRTQGRNQSSHVQVTDAGKSYFVKSADENLYKTFDDVIYKLRRQLT